jgi:hypothetical protein
VATGGTVAVSWAASTLANGVAVSGYAVTRYSATNVPQAVGGTCSGLVAATTCTETGVPTGTWTYTITPRFATNWMGAESAKSAAIVVDATPPTNAITLNGISGGAVLSGTTVYYRGVAAGSFKLTNAVTDANSGPASSATAALTGTTTGWTHTPSIVTAPSGGPYVSNVFSWTAGTTSSPGETVTGADAATNTAASGLTFVNDSTAPAIGTITYLDGYQPARSVSVTFAAGTDAGSGVAARQLQRAHATLSGGTCGAFSNFYNIGSLNPVSPYTDTAVYNLSCYKYQYVVTDAVGNPSITTSPSVSKLDFGAAVGATPGLLSWWRFGEAPITSTDRFAGTAGALLSSRAAPDGTTWTRRAGDARTVVFSNNNDARQGGTGTSTYYTDEVLASPDYLVEADIVVHTVRTGDQAGVVGRLNTANANGTFYGARYNRTATTTNWELYRRVNGVETMIGTAYSQTLTAGTTYRLGLQMTGTKINLLVDGIVRVTATDANITAAGRGGIRLVSATAPSDTVGQAIDNFVISPVAADSRGTNPGDYHEDVTLGVPGITADNTAATFTSAYAQTMQTETVNALPVGAANRSVEVWFKTAGPGAGMTRQVLFNYGSTVNGQLFGAWLEPDGSTIVGWGHYADVSYTWAQNFQDNQWHQFVMTYDGTSVSMYLDGVPSGATAVAWNTVVDPHEFGAGGVLDPANGIYATSWMNGSLDELSFYSTVMDPQTVLDHYGLGTSPPPDTAGPTGGSVDATGLTGTGARYSPSTTLSIALNAGSDPSGLAASGFQLLRATATLTSTGGADGVCGTYGAYAAVGAIDPVSPVSDVVGDQACYRYRYVVTDIYGNATTYTSGDIKVDGTPPAAPALAFSGFTNTYWSGAGSTVYYRSAAATGAFTATASAADASSGIASYAFPALGTNWTSTPGALGVNAYSWSGAPAAPGAKTVTVTNNAGVTSGTAGFTMVADDTAPSAGTVAYVNGSTGGGTISVSFTTGTDGGSGLGTRLLQRAQATLTGQTCGVYGAFATVAGGTNPTSPFVDAVATSGFCYQYQYVVSDNVGNTTTATSANVAHAPYGAWWRFNEGAGTSAADSFSSNNTGALQAAAGWTAGKIGASALNLTGAAASFVDVPNPVIDSSQSYTVATWVRLNNLTGTQTFASIDGTNVSPFYLQMTGGLFSFSQRGSDATASTVAQVNGLAPAVGRWYWVVGVYDKTAGTIQLYVNGVSQGTATATTAWQATGHTVVGRAKWGGASAYFVNGALDETRFFDRPLAAAEVVALGGYSSAVTSTAGLINYWQFGEASGAVATDNTGAANGAYVSTPTLGVTGAIANDSNTAVTFNGTNQYATAPCQITNDFTLEFWFKSTQGIGTNAQWWQGAGLVDGDINGSATDFGTSLRSDGRVVAGMGPNPDTSIISSTAGFNDGNWHYVVFTRVRATAAITLYVDGVSQGTATVAGTAAITTPTIYFGRIASGGNFLNGSLDEVATYNVVLSPATIAAHFAAR